MRTGRGQAVAVRPATHRLSNPSPGIVVAVQHEHGRLAAFRLERRRGELLQLRERLSGREVRRERRQGAELAQQLAETRRRLPVGGADVRAPGQPQAARQAPNASAQAPAARCAGPATRAAAASSVEAKPAAPASRAAPASAAGVSGGARPSLRSRASS